VIVPRGPCRSDCLVNTGAHGHDHGAQVMISTALHQLFVSLDETYFLVIRDGSDQPAKSSSQNSCGLRDPSVTVPRSASARRSVTLRTLPEDVLGSSVNSTRRTRLYGVRRFLAWFRIACAVLASAGTPSIKDTNALTTDMRIGSGEGTTAASATYSCSTRTLSISNGETR